MTVADADKTNVFWCAVVWIFPSLLLFLCYSYLDVPLRRRGEGRGGGDRRKGEKEGGRGKREGKREGTGEERGRWKGERKVGG